MKARKPRKPAPPSLADLPQAEREAILVQAAEQLAREEPGRFEVVTMPNGRKMVVIRDKPH